MQKLRIEIDEATGEVSITGAGFSGSGCAAVIDSFAAELGTTVEDKKLPEYHKTVAVNKTQNAGR